MKRTSFMYRSNKYKVVSCLGQSVTDADYDLYVGKKEDGKKTLTVKIDRYSGQCLEIR